MHSHLTRTIGLAAIALTPAFAHAQLAIDWSTIDCGGGDTSGGTFTLSGTIAQPDAAAPITGGTFQITGGFWPNSIPIPCYANCDGVGGLTANDFACFLAAYTNGQSYANCDGVGGLTANDFACFLARYTNGCS